ncbi:hypothetical protein SJDPG2_07670 [Porphyromonas gingivalis SJD2]|nr:hypothetical protein EG14_05335 [Porphyromonas gingivalis]ETA26393.1 hypothetical protein SJDPG2_07670 [Porphyromonas gingivalis SJD2]OWR79164.1 hypothetical protein SJDPG5_04100 [Porphyromonas gingivalis SJD5]
MNRLNGLLLKEKSVCISIAIYLLFMQLSSSDKPSPIYSGILLRAAYRSANVAKKPNPDAPKSLLFISSVAL